MGNDIKIEINSAGGKISLKLEGNAATHDKLLQVVNSLKPILSTTNVPTHALPTEEPSEQTLDELSVIERVKRVIRTYCKHGWFNSKEILELYQHYIDIECPLSTVSTYLSRLSKEGILERRGSKKNLEYRMKPSILEEIPEISLVPSA